MLVCSAGLKSVPLARRAESLPISRHVVFAKTTGSIETMEGSVRHDAGDAIMTGDLGERWPIQRSVFEARYQPADGQAMGEDGRYYKSPRQIFALQASAPIRVDLGQDRGVLLGDAGDWIVDHGGGDMAIVAADVFPRTYRLLD